MIVMVIIKLLRSFRIQDKASENQQGNFQNRGTTPMLERQRNAPFRVPTGSGHVSFRTFLIIGPWSIVELGIILAYLDARMEQRIRWKPPSATEMRPNIND